MNGHRFTLAGAVLEALPSGALWWEERRKLVVSDLHLGKSARLARNGGAMLPPYETRDTLARLEAVIRLKDPLTVICLGDSFDDLGAAGSLDEEDRFQLMRLQAGRRWIWIEGNHDPGPLDLGGSHLAEMPVPPLTFRHIARAASVGEVSGHYHPKAMVYTRGGSVSRPCFLIDGERVILPAFGTFTGGLRCGSPALGAIMRRDAVAVLTGAVATVVPMPR